MREKNHDRGAPGFTLIEVLIAMIVLVTVAVGVGHLFAAADAAGLAARHQTSASILAAARMEQLRSLQWTWQRGSPALQLSDLTTNLSTDPPQDDGRGLRDAPAAALEENTPAYVDYLDADGAWAGNGRVPPEGAVFVRRWSVRGLPADPSRTLILQVLVVPVVQDAARGSAGWRTRSGDAALITTLRTRTGP